MPLILSVPPADGDEGLFTVIGSWNRRGKPYTVGVIQGPHETTSRPDDTTPVWVVVVEAVDAEAAAMKGCAEVGPAGLRTRARDKS